MDITDRLLSPGAKHGRSQRKMKPEGILVHYVGNPGSGAAGNRSYFENGSNGAGVSAHYIIGLEGEILRCVPDDECAAHAGVAYGTKYKQLANTNNSRFIGIECCHPTPDGKFNSKSYQALIDLCVDLCKRHKLIPRDDILRHYDVSGKQCPLYYVKNPAEWERLKNDIASAFNKPVTVPAPDIPGISIARPPTVTLEQMITWAQDRGSASWLIVRAGYYYQKGVSLGIDPAVAWVQTDLETGRGNFPKPGSLIDETWRNTAAIKTTQGGADSDPNAHYRFNTWEDGIDAQYDHLALYAGLPGYPKESSQTKDPRQFASAYGKAKTVQALKGTWATDKDYDTKLIERLNSLWATGSPAKPPEYGVPASWAVPAWDWGIRHKITDGSRPLDYLTRQEALQLLYNLTRQQGKVL